MKILHIIPTYAPAWQFGGPVRSVSSLCEELAARGHEVTVLTTNAGLRNSDIILPGSETARNGVRVHYYPQEPGYGIKSTALESRINEFVDKHDVVHVTAVWQRTGPAACRASRLANVPYVISPRGALGPYSWKRGRIKKVIYYIIRERVNLSGAAGFHYTSKMEAAECERFRFEKPTCIIPNGLDFGKWSRIESAGQDWRAKCGIDTSVKVLLYAGRLHHKKGLSLLPKALAACSLKNWIMVFVGDDDDGTGQKLALEFSRCGLQDRVRFCPGVESNLLAGAYSGSDFFLLPSFHENFGNAALEAVACGCRVLASNYVGVAAELAALGAGEVLNRDVGVWSEAIVRNLSSHQRNTTPLEQLVKAFGIQYTAKQMEAFYNRLIRKEC